AAALPPPRLKVLPLAPVRRSYASRVLAVGDAAGLVKPTTGGGIYYGLLSGRIAADVLAEALARDGLDAGALAAYETRWRARLGPDIRAGLAFRAAAAPLDDRAVNATVPLARALRGADGCGRPPRVVGRPDRGLAGESAREPGRRAELRRLSSAFAAERIPALVCKGAAVAYQVYAQPWLRPRHDTDLLIRV